MRVIIDTNVIISSIFFGGKPGKIVELLSEGKFDAYATNEIIDEYQKTFEYLVKKYNERNESIPFSRIISLFKIIDSKTNMKICRDKDDDKFINCAIDSNSCYIVSGDKDLLTLKKYQDINIISANEFLNLLI